MSAVVGALLAVVGQVVFSFVDPAIEEAALEEPTMSHERFLAKPFTAAGLIGVVQDALRE